MSDQAAGVPFLGRPSGEAQMHGHGERVVNRDSEILAGNLSNLEKG
jgi:hypothetical protein